jgi:hypothetical protein
MRERGGTGKNPQPRAGDLTDPVGGDVTNTPIVGIARKAEKSKESSSSGLTRPIREAQRNVRM